MKIKSDVLTSEQCIISLQRLKEQNGFTNVDLAIHEKLCDPATEPRMFDNAILEPTYGLKFKKRHLISFKELDTNDTFGDSVRDGLNPEYDNINESIQTEGFKLNQLMPCAYQDKKSKKWIILEGRTRISILKAIDITGKLLINEYEKVNDGISDKTFALHSNTVYDAKGAATQSDLIRHLQNEISVGNFEFDATINQDTAKKEFKKQVKTYVKEKFPKLRLPGPSLDSLLTDAMTSQNVKHNIKAFSSLDQATVHLNTVLGICDDKKYIYVLTTTDEWGIFKRVIPIMRKMRDNNDKRKIRIVTCQLAPKDMTDWYLANLRVGMKMGKNAQSIVECFGGTVTGAPDIEIYGTLPQCEALAHKYPMDKLVIYSKVTKAEYNLYGEKI